MCNFVCIECGEVDPAFVVVCQKCQNKNNKQLTAEIKHLQKQVDLLNKKANRQKVG